VNRYVEVDGEALPDGFCCSSLGCLKAIVLTQCAGKLVNNSGIFRM